MKNIERITTSWNRNRCVEAAEELLRDLTLFIGPGFHPETPFDEYVDERGDRSFDAVEVEKLQFALDDACNLLESNQVDPCEIALPIQTELMSFK